MSTAEPAPAGAVACRGAKGASVTAEEAQVCQVDGDAIGLAHTMHIRMQAGALDIAVPAERTWMGFLPGRFSAQQVVSVVGDGGGAGGGVGRASRSLLNVPDPWYGTMADFVDTLEVVERVSDELAEQLTALRD